MKGGCLLTSAGIEYFLAVKIYLPLASAKNLSQYCPFAVLMDLKKE